MTTFVQVVRCPAAGKAVGGVAGPGGVELPMDWPVAAVALRVGKETVLYTRDEAHDLAMTILGMCADA